MKVRFNCENVRVDISVVDPDQLQKQYSEHAH